MLMPIGANRPQSQEQQQAYAAHWPTPIATGANQVAKTPPALENNCTLRAPAYDPAQRPQKKA